jgi:hypothetical protein
VPKSEVTWGIGFNRHLCHKVIVNISNVNDGNGGSGACWGGKQSGCRSMPPASSKPPLVFRLLTLTNATKKTLALTG